jgi:uncharacterized protein (DUF1697 family)
MTRYVALLRGINVGGKNLIRMAELKLCFEEQGFCEVATYIQSGNVLFATDLPDDDKLTRRIEKTLSKTFDYRAAVVLRSSKRLRDIVERAPSGFGTRSAVYRYDVIFLKEPLSASEAIESVKTRQGVDEAHAGDGVLYFRRLIKKASQSQLSRLVSTPAYQNMTIRNWNTTTKLVQLMGAPE